MAGLLAIHGQNYKATQLSAIDRHNFRLNERYGNTNIDRKKSQDNMVLIKPENGLYQMTKHKIEEEVIPYQKRSLRKDANWLAEFCVTMPDGVESKEDIRKYCETVIGYFADKVGKDNIISAVIHMDETTPHMHLDFVPITKDHKLSSKQIMTRQFLIDLHDNLPKVLQQAGFDVERGTPVPTEQKKEKSRNIKEYKKDAEITKETLNKEIHMLQKIKEMLLSNNYNLAKKIVNRFREHGQNQQR